MELSKAKEIAISVWQLLRDHCEICKIAGSIRREKPEVKDIEIVCLPKVEPLYDMFQEKIGEKRISEFGKTVLSLGDVVKGSVDGKYMQLTLKDGIALDLFMPPDFDYWRQYTIRTGSADWTAKYIAGGWKNKGWCGSDVGLRLQSECVAKTSETDGKKHWKCVTAKSQQTLPPYWKSEQEFFQWLGIQWVEPKNRNV